MNDVLDERDAALLSNLAETVGTTAAVFLRNQIEELKLTYARKCATAVLNMYLCHASLNDWGAQVSKVPTEDKSTLPHKLLCLSLGNFKVSTLSAKELKTLPTAVGTITSNMISDLTFVADKSVSANVTKNAASDQPKESEAAEPARKKRNVKKAPVDPAPLDPAPGEHNEEDVQEQVAVVNPCWFFIKNNRYWLRKCGSDSEGVDRCKAGTCTTPCLMSVTVAMLKEKGLRHPVCLHSIMPAKIVANLGTPLPRCVCGLRLPQLRFQDYFVYIRFL